MAEILFLICVSLILLGLHVLMSSIFQEIFKIPAVLILLGILVLFIPGMVFLRIFILAVVVCGMFLFFRKSQVFPLAGIAVLILLMVAAMAYFYTQWGESLRQFFFTFIDRLMSSYPEMNRSRIIEAFYSFWVYHEYIPGLIGVISFSSMYAAYSKKEYTFTLWMRYIYDFPHLWLIPAMLSLLSAFSLSFLKGGESIKMIFFNISLAVAFPLVLLGFLIIIFGLKKKKWPETVTLILLYSALVFSGPYFLFVLVMLFGIGISDSWMHYIKKHKKWIPL